MASQAVGFGTLGAGAILLTMGITNRSVREVLAGKASSIKPSSGASLAPGTTGPVGPSGPIYGGHAQTGAFPGWTQGRIDQGVDYSGGSKILAPEAGTIHRVGPYGGPSGGFGPGGVLLHTVSGKFIYFYEGLTALVRPGQHVAAGQQIAAGIPGGSIEAGFANASGQPLAAGEYTEGKVTVWGRKFLEWLRFHG